MPVFVLVLFIMPITIEDTHIRGMAWRSLAGLLGRRRSAFRIGGGIELRPKGPWGVLGELVELAPSPPARGLGERCKLPQWGPGRSPGRY